MAIIHVRDNPGRVGSVATPIPWANMAVGESCSGNSAILDVFHESDGYIFSTKYGEGLAGNSLCSSRFQP